MINNNIMSEDLKIIIEAFNELEDNEQIDFFLHFEELFKELFKIDLKEKRNERDRLRYKNDENFRKSQSIRAKRYYEKKKLKKEKNKSNIKDANINISQEID